MTQVGRPAPGADLGEELMRPVHAWSRHGAADAWEPCGHGLLLDEQHAMLLLDGAALTRLRSAPPPLLALSVQETDGRGQPFGPRRVDLVRLSAPRRAEEWVALVELSQRTSAVQDADRPRALHAALSAGRRLVDALAAAGVTSPPPAGRPPTPDPQAPLGVRPVVAQLSFRRPEEVGRWICRIVPWCEPPWLDRMLLQPLAPAADRLGLPWPRFVRRDP